jgi:hypothetical protein
MTVLTSKSCIITGAFGALGAATARAGYLEVRPASTSPTV